MPVLFLALWLPSFINPEKVQFRFDQYPAPLYSIISSAYQNFPFFGVLVTFILLVIISLLLVRLNILFFFINTRTQLPALFYMLIASSYIPLQRGNPAIIGSFIFVIVLFRVFGSFKKEGLAYNYFDAALLLSIGSLFYFNLIFLLPVLWLALIMLREPRWREWVFTLLGAGLPYVFLLSYYYLTSKSYDLFTENIRNIVLHSSTMNYKYPFLIFSGYLGLLVMFASFYMVGIFAGKKIHARKFFIVLFGVFINILLVYLIVPGAGIELLFIIAIPLSYLISHYYENIKKKIWREVSFLLFLSLLIYLRIVTG